MTLLSHQIKCSQTTKKCENFEGLSSKTILERVENGSLSVWGKEGGCSPPHLVMPIAIKPTEPRWCHDERFLNLQMDIPLVSFGRTTDIPHYVEEGHYQTKMDDKSGYDHILLTWKGWYFVYNNSIWMGPKSLCLPCSWSGSISLYLYKKGAAL